MGAWKGRTHTSARELPTTTAAERTFFLGGAAGRGGGPGRASAAGASSPDPLLLKSLRPFCDPKSLHVHHKSLLLHHSRSACHGMLARDPEALSTLLLVS